MLITNFHMSGSNTSAFSALSLSAAAAVDVDANGGGGKFMNSFLHLQTSSPASASSSLHRGLRCAYAWRSQTAFVLLVLRKSLSSLSTRKSSNALWRRPSNSTRIRLFSSSSSAGSADEAAVHVGRKFGLRDPRFAEAERAKERRNGKGFEVIEAMPVNSQLNGAPFDAEVGSNGNTAEERLDELRHLLGKAPDDVLRIAGVGAGAWGSVFAALLQDAYGAFRDKFQVRIWRRPGRAVDRATAEHLFEVINSREDVLRRLIRRCAYLKYVEARLGDRVLYADEILKDGFCLNMIDNPLCPLKVVTNLQEAVWDADIVINGLPSTETKEVFQEISRYWKERRTAPIIISLAKGVEAALHPFPHIITPTQIIARATGVPSENVLYLGGPNIASEIYNKEYANARICGSDKWRKALAKFLRQPHFIVWDNNDLVTHEVMGGLKNVYAIGAGMVAALTNESATSKSVYFAHCTSEMIFITHLLSEAPEKLAGPLLADTYVTLLKGRNAWYGQMLAKGELSPDMGDSIKGKGMIQGVSAVSAFYELLSQSSLSLLHPDRNKPVAPVELCPILKTLYSILIKRDSSTHAILQALRDETMHDPRERIEIAQSRVFYNPKLLGQVQTPPETP